MKAVSAESQLSIVDALNRAKAHIYAVTAPIPERVSNVNRFLHNLGIPVESRKYYVDTIEAVQISPNHSMDSYIQDGIVSSNFKTALNRQKVTAGRLGCQLSMVRALTAFLKSSHSVAFVIEDDVTVHSDLDANSARFLLAQLMAIPTQYWDIQYLGFCFACNTPMNFPFRSIKSKRGSSYSTPRMDPSLPWISRGVVQLCRHAMLFTRSAAAVYLKEWKPMAGPGDVRLADIICETGLKVIRPGLPIFDQDRSLSKSLTGNSDKRLPPYRPHETCEKHREHCRRMYSVEKAKKYGLNYGPIV